MPQLPDLVNAVFEGAGGFFVYLSIRRLLRDKLVRGLDWKMLGFFTAWGCWNLFYYPHLDQWLSFAAGLGLVVTNAVYLVLVLYYTGKEVRR